LDLPGEKASSVISDNYAGAFQLTQKILAASADTSRNSLFVGGRDTDHNTKERIRGFKDAHAEIGIEVADHQILACGYAAEKAASAIDAALQNGGVQPNLMFVNSTISLEGVVTSLRQNGRFDHDEIVIGCFDWDPFAAMLNDRMFMVRQDVDGMMGALFRLIEEGGKSGRQTIEIAPIL